MVKKDYGTDEGLKIFDERDSNRHKLNEYSPKTSIMIIRKNEYLKIKKWKIIETFFSYYIIRKINNANYEYYVNKRVNEEMDSGDTHHTVAISDSFEFKTLREQSGITGR